MEIITGFCRANPPTDLRKSNKCSPRLAFNVRSLVDYALSVSIASSLSFAFSSIQA